jgi:tRNA pseudouridine38-40 synthase
MTDLQRCIGLHIVYEGTHFQGYQVQPQLRTVQSELEAALAKVFGYPCTVFCAGRTDAGVHARAQFVHLNTSNAFPTERLAFALRRHLPSDLAVLEAHELPFDFHARFSALSRRYRYYLRPESIASPFNRRFCWHYPYAIDRELLTKVWGSLSGSHNFKPFCKSGSYRTQFNITIQDLQLHFWENGLIALEIQAQSFLYNMVRTLVGTSLDIARGRWPEEHMAEILTTGERAQVGLTAPPQGLFLWDVCYAPELGLDLAAKAEAMIPFNLEV